MNNKLLLSELRICEINPTENITNELLTKAVTVNAEINNFGFTLLPKDIIRLASDSNPENILNLIVEVFANKGYKPMYPGFPKEVMEMDEAVYRFHQALHYLSTYGLEFFTGEEVSEGWMPTSNFEENEKEAAKLKELTVIELCTKEEIADRVKKYIINKTELWTNNEAVLANDFFTENPSESFVIPFKENIYHYYSYLRINKTEYNKNLIRWKLKQVCQHTGDVLDLLENILYSTNKFSTSDRRIFSKLLDMYSEKDLSENLIRQEKRNKKLLNYLSYNKYSRNPVNKETVRKFRNDELRSWNSLLEEKIKNHSEDTLDFISKRPGELFRRIRELLNRGYSKEDILAHINGEDLKIQSLVGALNTICNFATEAKGSEENTDVFVDTTKELLVQALAKYKTPLTNKKVYFDKGQYSPENSVLSIDKTEEGGYIRSGLAFAIPENVDIVREFIFWDDRNKRVDLDLHSYAFDEKDKNIHIGWDGDFNRCGITTSGDITTSNNSAEYIDVNIPMALEKGIKYVTFNINYFNGSRFSDVNKCFFGIEAAKNDGSKLYDPKNLYFYHDLTTSNKGNIDYAVFDLTTRTIRLLEAKENITSFSKEIKFSLADYLDILGQAQNVTFVNSKEDADIVVTLDKQDNTYCLIDKNFLLEGDKDYVEEEGYEISELEDGQTMFKGSLEDCNTLLSKYNGCIGRVDGKFFWKGEATLNEVLTVAMEDNAHSYH